MKERIFLFAVAMTLLGGAMGVRCFGRQVEQGDGIAPGQPRVRVRQIEFEGNKIFSDDELLRLMKNTNPGALYIPEVFKEDLERVRFFVLAAHGYLKAQLGEPRVELIRSPHEGLRIVVPIDEGRQFRFARITIEGNTVFSAEQIKAIIGITPGDVVRSTVLQKGVYETLKDLYGRFGYIRMIAGPNLDLNDDPGDPTEGTADFTLTIKEGRQYRLRYLEFAGNATTRDKVLRREILVSEGQVFNEALWKESLQNLNRLGLFEEITASDATFKPDERTGTVDIELRVKEKERN